LEQRGVNRLEERQATITELALILNTQTPSPNEAMILNAWLKVKEIQFMNQFGKRRSRYSWKDIGIITAVVLLVGGCSVGISTLFLDTVGPECMVIHCVKVIK
jgi:hypothetical protein